MRKKIRRKHESGIHERETGAAIDPLHVNTDDAVHARAVTLQYY